MTEQEKQEIIQTLVSECKWHFDNSANYYAFKNEFKRREDQIVKPLGAKLYDAGGLSMMRNVYQQVENICVSKYGKNCRSALDMKWNGVGEWMS